MKDACLFWNQFTSQMNNINRRYSYLYYNCTYNASRCDGVDCRGAIHYKMAGIKIVDVSFCFGMRVNHCDNPISMDMYYKNPENSKSDFNERIQHNDMKELMSLTMNYSTLGTVTPFIFFSLTKPDPHHVVFGIRVKMRLTTSLFGFEHESWPSQYQQDIIPPTEIPVTPCSDHLIGTIPLLTPSSCVHTTFPTFATTPAGPINVKSRTYNKTCSLNRLETCSNNEMCQVVNETYSICLCMDNQLPNKITGLCGNSAENATVPQWPFEFVTTTVATITRILPQSANQSKDQSIPMNKPAVIGGAVAGGVAVVAFVILAVVVWRRYRSNRQYIGRLLLDNDDETDNVI